MQINKALLALAMGLALASIAKENKAEEEKMTDEPDDTLANVDVKELAA